MAVAGNLDDALAVEEDVDQPSLWPPVTTTAFGPSSKTPRASSSCVAPSPKPVNSQASGIFGVATVRSGSSRSTSAVLRLVVHQRRPALSHHHRIDNHRRRRRPASSARRNRSIVAAEPSMPIFTASAPMSSATARIWSTIVSGETASTASTADGVLRGDRGDRSHSVHAAARKRLQVGLDARAAAGVRAGDRESGRDAVSGCIDLASLDASDGGCRFVRTQYPHQRAADVAERLEVGERGCDLTTRKLEVCRDRVAGLRTQLQRLQNRALRRLPSAGPARSIRRTPGPSIASSTS